jgi:pimeloyl-ACP methyl ester carboxylesterase
MLSGSADEIGEGLRTLLSPVDAEALDPSIAEWLVRSAHDGLATSDDGWWDDGVAQLAPWGFELDEIRMPVQVWQGRQDRFVPYGHGEWLAAHTPGAEPHLTENDGHITLIRNRIGEVHRWLLDRLGA